MTGIDVDDYFAAERDAVELLPAPSGQYERVRRGAARRRRRGPAIAAVLLGLAAGGAAIGIGHQPARDALPDANRPRPLPVAPAGTIGPGAVPPHFKPQAVSFVTATHGFALGSAPCRSHVVCAAVVETTDGGASWRATRAPAQASAGTPGNRIAFFDDRVGWIYGTGLWVTSDGGGSWQRQRIGVVRDLAVGDMALGHRAFLLTSCRFATRPGCDPAKGPVLFWANPGAPAGGWRDVGQFPSLAGQQLDGPGYRLVVGHAWIYIVRPGGGLVPASVDPITDQFPNPSWEIDPAALTARVVGDDGSGPVVVTADRSVWRLDVRTGHLRRVGSTPRRPGYGNDTRDALPDAIAASGRRIVAAYKLPGGPSSGSLDVSDDGGKHWIVRVGSPLGIVDVQLRGRFGVALTESAAGTMYFSHDGGEHWTRYRFP